MTLYRCTRCGRIVAVDLEKSDGCVPFCKNKLIIEGELYNGEDFTVEICGGRLEKASKGETEKNI